MSRHGLFADRERDLLEAVAALAHVNPFLPERVEAERRALGETFVRTQVKQPPMGW